MICGISGNIPEEPVVSTKSGHVYEKRLIEKYIEAHGKDPVTSESLSASDLLVVKVNKSIKPRPVVATSIPSMLQLFQNEWDALMLETFTLKQHLETVRQELAHALYQHDAACRVIARLIKERDQARSITASVQAPLKRENGDAMDVDPKVHGLSDQVKDHMQEKSQTLSKDRKKRQQSPSLATPEQIKEYKVTSSHSGLHKANAPGISSIDIHPANQEVVLTGGLDGNAILFNTKSEKILSTLAHPKKVNDAIFHPTQDLIFTASQDKVARVWKGDAGQQYTAAHLIKTHAEDVVGLSLHPTGDYLATASLDRTWAFHDINTGQNLVRVSDPSVKAGYQSVTFHPDGLILGTGTVDSLVRIWDVKSQQNVATFEGHQGKVLDIAFSENGFYLATAAEDSVKLWDLRKLKNFHTIAVKSTSSVSFDYSGNYLVVAGEGIRVYAGKTFSELKVFGDHGAPVSAAKFGNDAKFLVSGSLDRTVKLYA